MAMDVAPSSSSEPLSPFLATVAVMTRSRTGKAIIGLCCLTLPAAFAEVGLTLALVGIVLVCVALGTGTYRVAQCYVQIRHSKDKVALHGLGPLGDISEEVFGLTGVRCCYVAILASQFGIAVAYVDVIVPTVMKLMGLSKLAVQLWMFGLSGAMSFIKELQGLAWLSIVALSAFMYIAFALLHFGIVEIRAGRDSFEDSWLPLRFAGLGAFLGPTISAFEGVVVAQYAFADMRVEDPTPFRRVVVVSHAFALVLFAFIGCFGLGVYGGDVSELIYESFPAHSIDVQLCKVTVCIVQMINFQVQMYPIFTMGDTALRSWLQPQVEGSNLSSGEDNLRDLNEENDKAHKELLEKPRGVSQPSTDFTLRALSATMRWRLGPDWGFACSMTWAEV
ncbi:AVT3B [Symbiodinium natans]|uniref:AVT3B protein n=1 Tax=Symbiodinium natans TaxID=878477 RepID=A0A812RGQ2_9DINO|nr:AVT3B [Symbiodinium natans]